VLVIHRPLGIRTPYFFNIDCLSTFFPEEVPSSADIAEFATPIPDLRLADRVDVICWSFADFKIKIVKVNQALGICDSRSVTWLDGTISHTGRNKTKRENNRTRVELRNAMRACSLSLYPTGCVMRYKCGKVVPKYAPSILAAGVREKRPCNGDKDVNGILPGRSDKPTGST
jgi:hypothetical protein